MNYFAGFALLVGFLVAGEKPKGETKVSLEKRLLGDWETKPFKTDEGTFKLEISFRTDGKFILRLKPLGESGKEHASLGEGYRVEFEYKVENDKLILKGNFKGKKEEVVPIKFETDTLVWPTEEGHKKELKNNIFYRKKPPK